MMRIEWEDTWINTLIDAGFSPGTARATYQAMYGEEGPDYNKNPAQEAMAMLGIIKIPEDLSCFSENISTRHSNTNQFQPSSKLDLLPKTIKGADFPCYTSELTVPQHHIVNSLVR